MSTQRDPKRDPQAQSATPPGERDTVDYLYGPESLPGGSQAAPTEGGRQQPVEEGTSPRCAPAAALPPESIGRFQIERSLGHGAFGEVYLAYDPDLHRPVAIKVLRTKDATAGQNAAFLEEGRILAKLDHPGIVPVYEVGRLPDGRRFVVMKYVTGPTLAQRMKVESFTPTQAAGLVAELADALAHSHRSGVYHRDIKPSNILLTAAGRPCLTDFGLALRNEDFGTGPTSAGTPCYMSPEQARREGDRIDGRSDIYNLGVVFYELLTGQKPYRSQSVSELVDEIIHVPVRPPREIDPAIRAELERICLKCLAKSAEERYATASDLASELVRWLTKADLEATPAGAAGGTRRKVLLGAAGAALGLVAVLVLDPFRRFRKPPAPAPASPPDRAPPRVVSVELAIRRDQDDSRITSYSLVAAGQEQLIGSVAPLGPSDDLRLYLEFSRPTYWYLVQIDPAGETAIVGQTARPEIRGRVPQTRGQMARFRAEDPKGVHLLLLVTSDVPPVAGEDVLAGKLRGLAAVAHKLPPRWSQLRAGMTEQQSAAQLPQDLLHDMESALPAGFWPAHALFLRTVP